MMPFAEISPPTAPFWLVALILAAVGVSLAFWAIVLMRRMHGRTALPSEAQRSVPWQGVDLLVILAAYFAMSGVAVGVVRWSLGPERVRPMPAVNDEVHETAHVVLKALAAGGPWVVVLCVVAVVVVAPVVEEFLFRLLLQGWLEARMERWAFHQPAVRRFLPGAAGPIFVSSLLFAAAHYRVAGPRYRTDFLVAMLLAQVVIGFLLVCFAVGWLRLRVGISMADLGIVPDKLAGDVQLGLWSLVGLLGPVYAIQIASHLVLPEHIAPDPIPLFVLAIGLGVLFARTRRLAPCIVLHAALNAVGLGLAWATLPG